MDGLQGLAGLAKLDELALDMSDCEELLHVDGLQSLSRLAALKTLLLNLNGCSKLANVHWAAIKRLETSKFKFKFPRARNLEIIGLVLGCVEAKFCK